MSSFALALKIWLLAELSARVPITSKVGGSDHVLAWGEEVPGGPGVYVKVGGDPQTDEYAGESEVQIRVLPTEGGEQACWVLAQLVIDALYIPSGRAKEWAVAPRTKDLAVKSTKRTGFGAPERDGHGASQYATTLTFDVKGHGV